MGVAIHTEGKAAYGNRQFTGIGLTVTGSLRRSNPRRFGPSTSPLFGQMEGLNRPVGVTADQFQRLASRQEHNDQKGS
jgi:hypothetical protein